MRIDIVAGCKIAVCLAFILAWVGCGGGGGGSTLPPSLSLSASPQQVEQGQTTTLTWSSQNANTCMATGQWSGSKPVNGSELTGVLNTPGMADFKLTCTGPGGSATKEALVEVTASLITEVMLPDIIEPVTFTRITVEDGPEGSGVEQIAGPPVNQLEYSDGQLSFISPLDTGEDFVLKFRLADENLRVFALPFTSRLPMPVASLAEGGDEGVPSSSPVDEDISISIRGMINNVVLPRTPSELVLSLSDTAGPVYLDTEYYTLHLNNADQYESVSDLFELTGDTGLALRSGAVDQFTELLRPGRNRLEFFGKTIDSRFFAFEISFFYGLNTIFGQVLNEDGASVSLPQGSLIALKGLETSITFSTAPDSSGNFTFNNVPTDGYDLSVIDPSGTYSGTALFTIESSSQEANVPLVVFGPSPLPQTPRSGRLRQVRPDPIVPEEPPEHEPIVYGEVVAFGREENITISAVDDVRLPQGTGIVKIAVWVYTFEDPGPDNPTNDLWRYEWKCGEHSDSRSGQINETHAISTDPYSPWGQTYDRVIDVTKDTVNGPITCRIEAHSTNIGDSDYRFATDVHVSIESVEPFSIRIGVRHISGLFMDHNRNFHMGIPIGFGALGTRRSFILEIAYFPILAEIVALQIEIAQFGEAVIVTENQPFTQVKEGLIRAEITLPSLDLPLSERRASLFATVFAWVEGDISSGQSISAPVELVRSDAVSMKFANGKDLFSVLYETRNLYNTPASRRYQSYGSDPRQDSAGGDGWGRKSMLDFLHSGTGSSLILTVGKHLCKFPDGVYIALIYG